jgi:hypothetical protein
MIAFNGVLNQGEQKVNLCMSGKHFRHFGLIAKIGTFLLAFSFLYAIENTIT